MNLDHVNISTLVPTPDDVRITFGDELVDNQGGGDTLDGYIEQRDFIKAEALKDDSSQPCVATGLELVEILPKEAWDGHYADTSMAGGGYASFAALRFESADVASQYMDAMSSHITACEGYYGTSEYFPPLEFFTSEQEGALGLYSSSGSSAFYQRGNLVVRSFSDVSVGRADQILQMSVAKLDRVEAEYGKTS